MPTVRTLLRLEYEYLERQEKDVLAMVFASGGALVDRNIQVAAGGIVAFTIGAGVSDDLPALTLFYVRTDLSFSVELVGSVIANNSNLGGVGPGAFLHRGAQTRVYNAAGGFAGALQNITKISVKNDGATAANWRVVAC